jgi:hypothetical protein
MRVNKKYILNRNIYNLKKGDIVETFTGYTYGCIKDDCIAVRYLDTGGIKPKHASNFIEVSLDFLDEYVEVSNLIKRKVCRPLRLLLNKLIIKN